jgi:hypothetical protein
VARAAGFARAKVFCCRVEHPFRRAWQQHKDVGFSL